MRFGLNFNRFAIPEWKNCYINYELLKKFVILIGLVVQKISLFESQITKIQEVCPNQIQKIQLLVNQKALILKGYMNQLWTLAHLLNKKFYLIYKKQLSLCQNFYQMKCLQMSSKFQTALIIGKSQLKQFQLKLFLQLIEFIYIQTVYAKQMRETNYEGIRKILKKHAKNINKYLELIYPQPTKMKRIQKIHDKLINEIEDYYVSKNKFKKKSKNAREYLRLLAKPLESNITDIFLFGLWIGISISIILVLVIVCLINKVSIQNNSHFSQHFPCWRGIGLFILYIWVIGLNVYIFEKFKISHRLILKFDDFHYSTSTQILVMAGTHTSIFLILYLLYILLLTKTIQLSLIQPSYIVLISWSLFFINILIPLPILNYKGRLYCLKLMFKSVLALCLGVNFPIAYATDQLVSLITPLKDLAYTVCYFANQTYSSENICGLKKKFQVVFIVAMLVYLARIFQCIRQGIDNKKYWGTIQFLNTIKYVFSLITALLSYLFQLNSKLYSLIFWIWLIFAVLSTLYSYSWDIKMDWNLLQKNSENFYLRKIITFPKKFYYIVIFVNFIMRCSWTLILSSKIIEIIFGNSNTFNLCLGVIEISRRGFWNLFRVQKQHLQNCINFKALPNIHELERILKPSIFEGSDFQNLLKGYLDKMTFNRQHIDDSFLRLIKIKLKQKNRFCTQNCYNDQDFQLASNKIKSVNPKDVLNLKDHSTLLIIDEGNNFLSSY